MHELADIADNIALHDELELLVRENGPTEIDWLGRRARRALKDARIDDDVVDHMPSDQYVVAILGHLAWRTPFADDLGPWETWDPEQGGSVTPLRAL